MTGYDRLLRRAINILGGSLDAVEFKPKEQLMKKIACSLDDPSSNNFVSWDLASRVLEDIDTLGLLEWNYGRAKLRTDRIVFLKE